MALISIDTESCIKDGLCRTACALNLIEYTKGNFPKPIPNIETECIRCGHCVAVCPTRSLDHIDLPLDECVEIDREFELKEEEVIQFIKSRRTARNFKDKAVSRPIIEKVLDITRFAPTGHNDQDVRWSIFDKKEDIKALADSTIDFFEFLIETKGDNVLPFSLKDHIDLYKNGNDVILRDAPVLMIAHGSKDRPMTNISCYIALTTLELAAKGCGLGTCWAGLFMFSVLSEYKPLLDLIDLPKDQRFYGAMMMGYPILNYKRIPVRKKPLISWKS